MLVFVARVPRWTVYRNTALPSLWPRVQTHVTPRQVEPQSSDTPPVCAIGMDRADPTSAIRSGAMVFGALLVGTGAGYLFNLVAARSLGAERFGALVSLMYVVTLTTLPLSALQMTLARELSATFVHGETSPEKLRRGFLKLGIGATIATTLGFAAIMAPLGHLLQINSIGAVALAGLSLVPAPLFLVLLGDLQGQQAFGRVAVGSAFPAVARVLLLIPLLLIGLRLNGALLASAVSGILGLGLLAWWKRAMLKPSVIVDQGPPLLLFPLLKAQIPVATTLFAVTSLTSVDLLMVKGSLSGHASGIYSAVSVLGRVAFFVPTVIATILFPRVAARRARDQVSDDILGRALLVTLGVCVMFFAVLAVFDDAIIRLAFGAEFREAAPLLWKYGVGMTLMSLVTVAANYHLSRGDANFAWLLAGGAALHAAALGLWHQTLEHVIWVNAATAGMLLIAHEIRMGSSAPAIRAGITHLVGSSQVSARMAPRRMSWLRERRKALMEAAAVTSSASALAVYLTWPLAAHMRSSILGPGGDSTGAIYWLWRTLDQGYNLLGSTPQTGTGAPFGWIEGNATNVTWALVSLPTYLATRMFGEIAAYNLMILASLVVPSVVMYAFVRRLRAGVVAAGWAALVYMIFPWHIENAQGHGALATIYLFPLLLWAGLLWFERPTVLRAALLGAANLGLWLTTGYYGIVACIATLVIVLIVGVREGRARGWTVAAVQVGVVSGLLMVAAGVVFVATRLGSGPNGALPIRADSDLQTYGARLHEYFVPSYRSVFFGDDVGAWVVAHLHGSNPSEATLNVGILTTLLATGFILKTVRQPNLSSERRFALGVLPLIVMAGFVFSLPDPIRLGSLSFTAPSRLVHEVVPSFRVPTRMLPLIMTALVALAALMLHDLAKLSRGAAKRLRRFPKLGAAAGVLLVGLGAGALSYVELATVPPAVVTSVGNTPGMYAALRKLPAGAIAEYPLASQAEAINSEYLFWQRIHRRPLINGAGPDTFADSVRQTLIDPASPGTAETLSLLGASAITIRPTAPTIDGRPAVAQDPGKGYTLVRRFADGSGVWRVSAKPREAFATFSQGFGASEVGTSRLTSRWMARDGKVVLYATEPGLYKAIFDMASYGVKRTVNIVGSQSALRLSVAANHVVLDLLLPRGFSELELTASPGTQLLPDGRAATIYVSNWNIVRRVTGKGEESGDRILASRSIGAPPSVARANVGRPIG